MYSIEPALSRPDEQTQSDMDGATGAHVAEIIKGFVMEWTYLTESRKDGICPAILIATRKPGQNCGLDLVKLQEGVVSELQKLQRNKWLPNKVTSSTYSNSYEFEDKALSTKDMFVVTLEHDEHAIEQCAEMCRKAKVPDGQLFYIYFSDQP